MPTVKDSLAFIRAQGWAPVHVEFRDKRPLANDWPRIDFPDSAFEGECNIGVALGKRSRWLVDVDLDCQEAVDLAPQYLPETWVFGRKSKPFSHWLYLSEGCETRKFQLNGGMLLELRSTGCQTVFPGSIHTSGEAIKWEETADAQESPRVMTAEAILAACRKLATACVYKRHGQQHEFLRWQRGGEAPFLSMQVAESLRRMLGMEVPRIKASVSNLSAEASAEFQTAVDEYNRQNRKEYPRSAGTCPICKHNKCFGRLLDSDRWCCFSASHEGYGVQSEKCWTGDALDIDAADVGVERHQLLKAKGYPK